jgi:hypothetical protein
MSLTCGRAYEISSQASPQYSRLANKMEVVRVHGKRILLDFLSKFIGCSSVGKDQFDGIKFRLD